MFDGYVPASLIVIAVCSIAVGCAGAQTDSSPPTDGAAQSLTLPAGMPAAASVQDGVFAASQSRRGELAYMDACRRCHQRDLMGDFVEDAPPLVGEEFLSEWSQWTVGDLYEFLTTEMPPKPTERREVSAENYADIVAFILDKNGYPAGQSELPADFDSLSNIEMSP